MSVPVSTKPFGWIFMRCSLWTPREGLDRLVSGSREPSLLSSVLQSLATNCRNCPYLTLACGWGLVHSKWIESQVYKGQYYSFVHLIIFLRMEQQKRNWSVWSTTFLWAGRVYSILSYFSIFFFFWDKSVTIPTTHLSFARRILPFVENNMLPLFILHVFIFKFGSKPLRSIIDPQTPTFSVAELSCRCSIVVLSWEVGCHRPGWGPRTERTVSFLQEYMSPYCRYSWCHSSPLSEQVNHILLVLQSCIYKILNILSVVSFTHPETTVALVWIMFKI